MTAAIIAGVLAAGFAFAPETAPREERFANPPASARLLPICHREFDDPEKVDETFARLDRRGYGGFVANVRFGEKYLEDPEAWATLRTVVRRARAEGLHLWLYDEDGYPSGTAAGRVTRNHPEYEAQGLLFSVTNVSPGATVALPVPKGVFKRAVAYPLLKDGVDAKGAVELGNGIRDGVFSWTAPTTEDWLLSVSCVCPLFEGTHAAVNLSHKIPYINILDKEPTDAFLRITHEAYARELGEDLRGFYATFNDESSLMSRWHRKMPWYPLPWSESFAEEYRRRFGRDLTADAPLIVSTATDGSSARLRHRFWKLVGDRVADNYFGRIRKWAENHGLKGGGHLLVDGEVDVQVPCYGNFFKCLRAIGDSGCDFLSSLPDAHGWCCAQFAGSAAALNGAKHAMCEVSDHAERHYKPKHTVDVDEVNGTINRILLGGVNTLTSYYSFEQFTDEQVRQINLRAGRLVTLLSEGPNAAETAVLYPADALMAGYVPIRNRRKSQELTPPARRAATAVDVSARTLSLGARDWMFCDADSIEESVVDSAGKVLTTKGLRWKTVVLSGADTLPLAAMRKLHAFWKAGGKVVTFGGAPVNSTEEFPSDEMKRLSFEMFGTLAADEAASLGKSEKGGVGLLMPMRHLASLCSELDALSAPPVEFAVECDPYPIRLAHRKGADGYDMFLLVVDFHHPWGGRVKVLGGRAVELWDPVDGAHRVLEPDDEGYVRVSTAVRYGAVVLTAR